MKSEIEISPYGNMLVYKKGYTADFVSKVLTENNLDGLRIFDHSDALLNLNFLKDYNFLKKLHIDCLYDQDYKILEYLVNLEDLTIGGSLKKNMNQIDLSNQINLKILGISWRKNIVGLDKCSKLLRLTLVDFTEKDLQKIQGMQSLVELNVKTSKIESLKGIERLVNLNKICISDCKILQNIHFINHFHKLKELYIDKCPNINDYNKLHALPVLENLSICDCGKIESLIFIEHFPKLQKLSLLGNTIIHDGNLIPAKHLKYIVHKHYSHYNIKLENKYLDLKVKLNLKKIKKWFG